MEGDKGLQAADARAANEDGRGGIASGGVCVGVERRRGGEGGDLVVVQFDDGGVDAEGGQQLLHDVAHAARGSAEDDHRVLRYKPPDAGLRRLRHVD